MNNADIKKELLEAMEAYLGTDTKRINHAYRVTSYAEELMKWEGGDYAIVIGELLYCMTLAFTMPRESTTVLQAAIRKKKAPLLPGRY